MHISSRFYERGDTMTDMLHRDPVYTVAHLESRWGVSDSFIYSLMKSGELSSFRLGGKLWRIRASAVEEYEQRGMEAIAAATVQPAANPAAVENFQQHRDLSARLARLTA
jgi:excisionase family DNA binding protein